MSNLCAFYSAFRRAERAEYSRKDLNESLFIKVPTTVVIFAEKHIRMLEDQQAAMQKELSELRLIAGAAKVSLGQLSKAEDK